jgi:putative heme-binding domain-containing protein
VPADLAKRAAGNLERGKAVMAASLAGNAQCLKCHTVRGVGGQVGPDLSMVGKKGSRENLFESILQPSKAIADQYVQHQVTTAAGLTVTGLPIAETETTLTLRDANGKDTAIKKDDIEARKPLKTSIMPDDIAASLTEEELIDLVAYLQTLQTAALSPDAWLVAGPFDSPRGNAGLEAAFLDEKAPPDLAAKFPTKAGAAGWQAVRANAQGYFDLAALHGTAGTNSVSYAAQEVVSPADQDAEVLLGTDDGAKLFVNGVEVFRSAWTKAASPAQHSVPVKLKAGKNTVLLKVANGNNPHGFYFTILSPNELKVTK